MKLTPFSASLKDGSSVLIREVTQEDRHLLEMGFRHLSDRSKYLRFLAARHDLTVSELDHFTASNGPGHVAIGALTEGAPMAEPVGIARYIKLPEQDRIAEIAITIVDSHQHQGLGSVLLGVLAKFAGLDGFTEFSALVHSENRAMLGLLRQLGGVQTRLGGAEIDVRIPVPDNPAHLPRSSVGDAFINAFELAEIGPPNNPQLEISHLADREFACAATSELTDEHQKAANSTRNDRMLRSTKVSQTASSHQKILGYTSIDQSISVWVNEGGAIV